MRNYLTDMKHVIGFTAILAALLVGMAFIVAGNAAAAPAGNNVTVGVAAVVPSRVPAVLESNSRANFNRPNFNRLDFVRLDFVRPAFNPFFAAPVVNPFFAPAINPFFAPVAINPFFGADLDFD